MSEEQKEQETCAQVEAAEPETDERDAITTYREDIADALGGRDLLRLQVMLDEEGIGSGSFVMIDEHVFIGPAGSIERWQGLIAEFAKGIDADVPVAPA